MYLAPGQLLGPLKTNLLISSMFSEVTVSGMVRLIAIA